MQTYCVLTGFPFSVACVCTVNRCWKDKTSIELNTCTRTSAGKARLNRCSYSHMAGVVWEDWDLEQSICSVGRAWGLVTHWSWPREASGGGAREEEMGVPLLDVSRRVKTALNLSIRGRVLGL